MGRTVFTDMVMGFIFIIPLELVRQMRSTTIEENGINIGGAAIIVTVRLSVG